MISRTLIPMQDKFSLIEGDFSPFRSNSLYIIKNAQTSEEFFRQAPLKPVKPNLYSILTV